MAIAISASVLSAYFDTKAGVTGATSAGGSTAGSAKAAPTPPWQSTSTAPKQSALVTTALQGGQIFTSGSAPTGVTIPSLSGVTVPSSASTASANYQNLFALYQGINALQGLAAAAASASATSGQQSQYATAFANGMSQLQTFLGKTSFNNMVVSEGTVTSQDESTEGVTSETDTYTTSTIYSGPGGGVVPAFSGDVQFAMTLTPPSGVATTVNFNLADMGSTPRTMANVVTYLNSQLKAAGATTRFKAVETNGTPQTTTVDGKTITLSTPPNNYALEIVGTDTENPTFTATSTSPAVYVTSTTGPAPSTTSASATSSSSSANQSQELLTFNGASDVQGAPANTTALSSGVSSALASATGPDGSVYVLADVNGTVSGQTINGAQDVALMKYDSAGNLVYTQTLGAADSASGYSLAVSPDGSTVAVAGSVTGPLNGSEAVTASTGSNAFVATFAASTGNENWSAVQPSSTNSAPTAVTFGANNAVYVVGTSSGSMPDSTQQGGTAEFLQGYTASGSLSFSTQFGAAGSKPAGIAVSGSTLYVAGESGGNAVVSSYALQSTGAPTAGATRNLGSLAGGSLAGIGVTTSGQVVVAGSTGNGTLSAGTVTQAYTSGQEGFVASLSASLAPASSDTLSYLAAPGNLTATTMTVSGDQVYLAGTVATTPPSGSGYSGTTEGYAAAVDPSSGAVTWSQTYQGTDDVASPTSISVAANGYSVLNQLGLPTDITYAPSNVITTATSVAAGDSFYVKSGSNAPQLVTISANETMSSLATAIQRASGFTATAKTVTINGEQQLKITPSNTTTNITLLAGPSGANALAGLGLQAGVISDQANATSGSSSSAPSPVSLGLNLPSSLNLGSAASIATAKSALSLAAAKIEEAYQTLSSPSSSSSSSSSSSAASSAATARATAQIANYKNALNWLQSNESTSSSTTSSDSLLI